MRDHYDSDSDDSSFSSPIPTTKRPRTSQRVRKRRKLKREKASQKADNEILTIIPSKCSNIINTYNQHATNYCISKHELVADPKEPVWYNKQQAFSAMPLPKYHQRPESQGYHDLTDTIKPPDHLGQLLSLS